MFKEKFSVKTNFLQYQSVISAVSKMKPICACTQAVTNTVEDLSNLLASTEFCKVAYKMLIKQIASIPHKSQSKWLSDCNSQSVDYIDWRSSYSLAFLCTRESKLRTFQFKFLHRRIATNSYLFKIGIASDNLCSFCKNARKLFYIYSGNVFLFRLFGMKLNSGWVKDHAFRTIFSLFNAV